MTSPFSIKQFLRLLKDLSRDALGQRIDRKANEFGNRRGRGSRAARCVLPPEVLVPALAFGELFGSS
jgi:hypothetical protein